MPDLHQFRLPDVGEGLTEADILSWSVAPGDRVVVNQTLVEVETAKAAVELPSPFAGVVAALHAAAGETVLVGRPIITIDTAPAQEDTAPAQEDTAPAQEDTAPAHSAGAPAGSAAAPAEGAREAVLVGYGPRSGPGRRRVRRAPGLQEQGPTPTAQAAFTVDPGPVPRPRVGAPARITRTAGAPPLASPPVRKLAKSLGVDLGAVTPTGPNRSVSREDVQRTVAGPDPAAGSGGGPNGAGPNGAEPNGAEPNGAGPNGTAPAEHRPDRHAREERIRVRGVRKHTAAAMVASAFTAPHVTEFVSADVTAMMELRDRLAGRPEFAGGKLSVLALVARAAIWAIARTPIVNSTWDDAAGEIVVKRYVNLGIAAATGRGLVVPNIKDAETLSLSELADALRQLAQTARAGRTGPADLAEGTFTITNVGVFGVDTGTPILNPGESAILALGAVRRAPWVVRRGDEEVIEARWVTQLALSFDHRVVDGEQGSMFLSDIADLLTDPGLALT